MIFTDIVKIIFIDKNLKTMANWRKRNEKTTQDIDGSAKFVRIMMREIRGGGSSIRASPFVWNS